MKKPVSVKLMAPIFAVLILLTTLLAIGVTAASTPGIVPAEGTSAAKIANVGTTATTGTWRPIALPLTHEGDGFEAEFTATPVDDAQNVSRLMLEYGITASDKWQVIVTGSNVTWVNGSTVIENISLTTDMKVAHTIKVVVEGASVTVYLDGNEVLTKTTDTAYAGGDMKLYSRDGSATFTNLKITGGITTYKNASATTSGGTWRSYALPIEQEGSNFVAEFTATPASTTDTLTGVMMEYGIAPGVKYQAIFNSGSAYVAYNEGVYKSFSRTNDMTATHTVKVVVSGKWVRMYLDGTKVVEGESEIAYTGGAFKLYGRTCNLNITDLTLKLGATLPADEPIETTTTMAGSTTTTGATTTTTRAPVSLSTYTLANVGNITGAVNTWKGIKNVPFQHDGNTFELEVTFAPATATDGTNTAGYIVKFGVGNSNASNPQVTVWPTSVILSSDTGGNIASKALTVDLTAPHTVKVEVYCSDIVVYLDGEKIITSTLDKPYEGGKFEFYSRSNATAAVNSVVSDLTIKYGTAATSATTTTTTIAGATTTTTTNNTPAPDIDLGPVDPSLEEVVITMNNAGSSNSDSTYRLVATDPLNCSGDRFILQYDFEPISKTNSEALSAQMVEYGVSSTGTKWQLLVWGNAVVLNYGTKEVTRATVTVDLTKSHRVVLAVNGTKVLAYLDGEKVIDKTTDDAFTGGAFQFYGRTGNVTLSNLKLTTYREKKGGADGERYLVTVEELANINAWRKMSNSLYVEKISPSKLAADNFTFEYKVTTTDGDKVNLFYFGLQDLTNRVMGPLCFFRIAPGLVEYWERPENSTTGDVRMGSTTNLPASFDGTEYTVKVVVEGKTATLFINGIQVMEVTTSKEYTGGGFNLADRLTTSTYSDIKVTYWADEAPQGPQTPQKPEVGDDMVWVENEALGELDDWTFIGSAESTYREYLSPVNVGQSNFQLDMEVEYLMGDGKQYYIDFGIQNTDEASRGKGPYYSFVFNQNTVFLYYRADETDELEKSWSLPADTIGDDPFDVRLYVDGTYAALYLGNTDTPVVEHVLEHAYTGGGFNVKSRNTFAFFNNLSIQSYMDKASASTSTTTVTKTTTTTAADVEDNKNPDTGMEFPLIVAVTASLAFAMVMVAASKRFSKVK